MRGFTVQIEWRVVQLFLDSEGRVDEVSLDTESAERMRCTCPQFPRNAKCKHTKFMKAKIADSDGMVQLFIPNTMTDAEAKAALSDVNAFRELVLKYGKIEYLSD